MSLLEKRDAIPVYIPNPLFMELLDCEVESSEGNCSVPSHHQFSQSLLNAEQNDDIWEVEFTEDGMIYFLNIALLRNMEMWYTWNNDEGEILLTHAKNILNDLNMYYPY